MSFAVPLPDVLYALRSSRVVGLITGQAHIFLIFAQSLKLQELLVLCLGCN